MNIFAFDKDPRLAALWLDDVRKNKMIVETCQIISTVMNVKDPNHGFQVYRSFNPRHGSIVWAMSSSRNCDWLLSYLSCLLEQRGPLNNGQRHACSKLILDTFPKWLAVTNCFDRHDLTPFSNNAANDSVGVSFKHIPNTILAYRMYINARWKLDTIKLSWRWGEQPKWKV